MRLLLIVAALTLAATGADAATRVAASGKPLKLVQVYSANPNCTPTGEITMRIVTPPEHGRVTIRKGRVYSNFAESNPRSVCNRRGVVGHEAVYTSARGYTGSDSVTLEAIYPNGRYRRGSFSIDVR